MTTNTKLEDWRERLDKVWPDKGDSLDRLKESIKYFISDLLAQERARVVKEAREALPKERDVAEPWDGGWNSYRDAALEALSRIGQEHD